MGCEDPSVKPLAYPLLADENIHPGVVQALRDAGSDVATAVELGLAGQGDHEVLRMAVETKRVVLTHDSDFGQLALRSGVAGLAGIVYLRPGHRDAGVVMRCCHAVDQTVGSLVAPFIVVAEYRDTQVRIRVRSIERE